MEKGEEWILLSPGEAQEMGSGSKSAPVLAVPALLQMQFHQILLPDTLMELEQPHLRGIMEIWRDNGDLEAALPPWD